MGRCGRAHHMGTGEHTGVYALLLYTSFFRDFLDFFIFYLDFWDWLFSVFVVTEAKWPKTDCV